MMVDVQSSSAQSIITSAPKCPKYLHYKDRSTEEEHSLTGKKNARASSVWQKKKKVNEMNFTHLFRKPWCHEWHLKCIAVRVQCIE